jgi:uncharacterized protein YjbI with pentapeptide repeats
MEKTKIENLENFVQIWFGKTPAKDGEIDFKNCDFKSINFSDITDELLIKETGLNKNDLNQWFESTAADIINFSGSVFENCDFEGTNLRGFDFSNTTLINCNFNNANFYEIKMSNAKICLNTIMTINI